MQIQLDDRENKVLHHALTVYLSNLRGEITKTDKHEWKKELHAEEDTIKEIMSRLN